MIHFLRNPKGQTLIECEAMDEDLSAGWGDEDVEIKL